VSLPSVDVKISSTCSSRLLVTKEAERGVRVQVRVSNFAVHHICYYQLFLVWIKKSLANANIVRKQHQKRKKNMNKHEMHPLPNSFNYTHITYKECAIVGKETSQLLRILSNSTTGQAWRCKSFRCWMRKSRYCLKCRLSEAKEVELLTEWYDIQHALETWDKASRTQKPM